MPNLNVGLVCTMIQVCNFGAAYAITKKCQVCASVKAYAILKAREDYATQGYSIIEDVIDYVYDYRPDALNYFTELEIIHQVEDAITLGHNWQSVIASGASELDIYKSKAETTRISIYNCFWGGFCTESDDFCGDSVIMPKGDFGSQGLSCAKCPSPGVFDGENAPFAGYPLGYGSCGIPNGTTFSDSNGSGVYSSTSSCMYELSLDEMRGGFEM